MAYYNNPYSYGNPYNQGNPMDRLNQQMQQLQQLQNQYQQMGMGQPMPQQSNSNVAMSNRGTYVYVNDYNDVVNYPTPADGNAVLFFNLDKGILWSKKFVNGANSIQAFAIYPLNNVSNEGMVNNTSQEEKPIESPKTDQIIDNMLSRITNMEDNFDKLMNMLAPKQPNDKPNQVKEGGNNGIQHK